MFGDKHPKGLPFLFFSEMWERFGYYLMIGIFALYLKDVKQGFGMTEAEASDLYGTFIAFVFLTPFLGGLLADRKIGYRKSIIFGGILMGLGYCLMSVKSLPILYAAMALVILGNGFFKPNISTILGNLYNEDRFKEQKDSGYNIFYMGINIGAFVCNFFGAAMYNLWGWGAAFITAGIGMFIGVIIFIIGTQHYTHADVIKPVQKEDMPLERILLVILAPAIVFGIIGFFIPYTFVQSKTTDAFIFACLPIVYYYGSLYFNAQPNEKRPIGAMLAIFLVSVAFWAVFKQNGTALTTWADRYTDREAPKWAASSLKSLQLLSLVGTEQDSIYKYDAQFRIQKDSAGHKIKIVGENPYLQNLPAEKRPKEGEKLPLIATNIFQSVNPGWVVFLTPLVVAFFGFLRSRKKEPSTPMKIFYGLFISALSMFCMLGAVWASNGGLIKSSPWWLVAAYGVSTVGELCLSPMGLSLVSKLSPPRLTAIMMGGWFLSTSIGNKLSGILATMWDNYDKKGYYFMVNFALLAIAAGGTLLMIGWLNRIFDEYTGAKK